MSWFDRQAAGDAEAFFRRLSAALDAAGVVSAMDTACGPYGLRRFVARAEVREGRVKLGPVDSLPLPKGGGPPTAAAGAAAGAAWPAAGASWWSSCGTAGAWKSQSRLRSRRYR